jgi:hypothetical protein
MRRVTCQLRITEARNGQGPDQDYGREQRATDDPPPAESGRPGQSADATDGHQRPPLRLEAQAACTSSGSLLTLTISHGLRYSTGASVATVMPR